MSFSMIGASNLLSIGYNATDLRRDASYYDLLASEARITSFIGIAQGKIPAGTLVRIRASFDHYRRRKAHPHLLEWLDV